MMEAGEGIRARIIAPLLLLGFVVLIYYPSLNVDFIFDDMPNIVLNPAVHPAGINDLERVLTSGVSADRPLALFSFALNYLADGLNVFGYHLVNITIHAVNTILLYFILFMLPGFNRPLKKAVSPGDPGDRISWSFYGAALWATNPAQTQAVTYIVQRMTSMAAMFYLFAILAHILYRRERISGRAASFAIVFAFILGLGAKEIILSLPAALILIDFCLFPRKAKKHILPHAAALGVAAVIGLIILKGHLPDMFAPCPGRNFSPWERVMSQWRILWHYLGIFFLPLPSRLHLTYGIEPSRGLFAPWSTITGLLAIIAAVATALMVRGKRPLITLAVLFYFLAQAIEASFVNLELAFIHRLYLPTIFSPLLLLPRPENVKRIKKTGPILLIVIALFSYWTVQRNLEWNASPSFWAANIKRGADTARAKNNLAASLIDNGRLREALPVIEAGLKIAVRDEDLAMLTYNRGYALFYLRRYPESEEAFRRVAKKFGTYRHTFVYLALLQLKKGRREAALKIASLLENNTHTAYQGRIIRSRVASDEKEFAAAEKHLLTAKKETTGAPIYVRQRVSLELARLYLKWGKNDRAYETFLGITREFPQNYSVWRLIYLMLKNGGDRRNAARVKGFLLSKGVKLNQSTRQTEGK